LEPLARRTLVERWFCIYLAKGSIDIITQVLAKELEARKIRINSINPGGTETEAAHALGVFERPSEF
jgi:NAD(P)-dependent dehydrogenase (short-subunit alcohol dehydrogenase family)